MKVVVYSVNIGGYDYFKTPKIYDPNIRYILFTDNKYFRSNIWEVCHIDFIKEKVDNRKKARYVKINSHLVLPKHDISIWVDHCYLTNFSDYDQLLTKTNFEDCDIMCYKHNVRKCLYDEASVIIDKKLDYPNVVEKQMLKYREEGYPENNGLFDSGFMIRKNNEFISSFNQIWWEEIRDYSGRDQLSQVYSSWRVGLDICRNPIGNSIYSNEFLTPKVKHSNKWSL